MAQISKQDELDIIRLRTMGYSYEDISFALGRANSTISRVIKSENLLDHIEDLLVSLDCREKERDFYKTWFYRVLLTWGVAALLQAVLYFIL